MIGDAICDDQYIGEDAADLVELDIEQLRPTLFSTDEPQFYAP